MPHKLLKDRLLSPLRYHKGFVHYNQFSKPYVTLINQKNCRQKPGTIPGHYALGHIICKFLLPISSNFETGQKLADDANQRVQIGSCKNTISISVYSSFCPITRQLCCFHSNFQGIDFWKNLLANQVISFARVLLKLASILLLSTEDGDVLYV